MKKNIFLDNKWQKTHLDKIKKRAGSRYTPELNVDLPIAEIFDGISRTKSFYVSIRKHYGNLNREFGCLSKDYECSNICWKLYQNLKCEITQLSECLDKLKKYNTKKIPWDDVNKQTRKANKLLQSFLNELREEKYKAEKQKTEKKEQKNQRSVSERLDSDIHYLYKVQTELGFFKKLSSSTKAKLSNSPFLFLTGIAGMGKTHLLCDVIADRITNKKAMPGILVFGELFAKSENPFAQIIRQLGLEDADIDKKQFLRLLNNAGKQSNGRAILSIDALNETSQRDFWKKNLGKVTGEIKKYPNIALIVSVRTGFEDEIITKKLRKDFISEQHRGFEFREWEAVNKLFKEFQLPLPEIPLLMPEFQNPLFLHLFCKAFQGRTKKSSAKKQRQVFKGHEGATYIFESFVNSMSKKIAKQFDIPHRKQNIWNTAIKKIAAKMVDKNDDRVAEEQIIALVKNSYPSIDHVELIKELERNLLIVKVPRYTKENNDYDGFDFRFPFQKFSDHLIGRYVFKKYETEFGKTNKNLQNAKKFFSKRRKLGKFLADSWNRGIVEALSIQCPEHLNGCELVEVAPYLKNSCLARKAFLESLIWRKPTAFSTDTKNTLAYINSEVIKTKSGRDGLLNTILAIAPVPDHPFNADFLHQHLSKFSMPKRDSWWSVFLYYQYEEKEAVDRLVAWGWSDQDKTHVNNESIRLCSVALCWFLTTPHRFLRDKTTKALIALLTNRLCVVLQLLKQFKDVNDPYISERLYAIAYGCAIRSRSEKKELKALSQWVYGEIFKQGNPPVNILLRDYARGVIEVALQENINIQISKKKLKPPYSSNWPKRVPSKKSLKNKYYPEDFFQNKSKDRGFLNIWSSVMYEFGGLGDFGRYVLNSAVSHWSGRRLNGKERSRKNLFNDFKEGLTKRQKELLEKAIIPFSSIDMYPNIRASIEYISSDEPEKLDEGDIKQQKKEQQKEMKKAFVDFRNSLSEKKKRYFEKEIKPFLDERGNVNDPFERFDTELAQRWVFNKVVQLGWEQKLHGQFDKDVNYHRFDRSIRKPERIGKKYQWIALYELLARISDNFEFKEESWSDRVGKYEGPWQLNIRNIDPSCVLKECPNTKPEHVPDFKWDIQNQYNAWHKNSSPSTWLKNTRDLPNPKKIIEFIDEMGIAWVALEGFVEWQEETPPEQEEYNLPTRTLWYMVKSYLVRKADKDSVFKWLKQQSFMGRWMPESHEFYSAYLGEYPWAPAFLYQYTPYYYYNGWTDSAGDKKIPAKILVMDDQYLSESSIDCSINKAMRVQLPVKFIVDGMGLTQKYIDGRFFNEKGELVAFDPSVFDEEAPSNVLIRKDKLNDFLKRGGYALFWTLLGEKTVMGVGDNIEQASGLLDIKGAYTLNEHKKIVGVKRSCFKEF